MRIEIAATERKWQHEPHSAFASPARIQPQIHQNPNSNHAILDSFPRHRLQFLFDLLPTPFCLLLLLLFSEDSSLTLQSFLHLLNQLDLLKDQFTLLFSQLKLLCDKALQNPSVLFSSHFSFHLDETGFYRRIPWKRPLHHMVDFFFCRFCPLPRVFLNSVTSKRSLSASNVTSLLQFVAANLLSIEPQLLPSLFTSIVYIPVQQSILVWFKVHFPSHLHP